MKEKLKEITEELYKLNARISLIFIGMKQKPVYEDMRFLNKTIGDIIKKLRELTE